MLICMLIPALGVFDCLWGTSLIANTSTSDHISLIQITSGPLNCQSFKGRAHEGGGGADAVEAVVRRISIGARGRGERPRAHTCAPLAAQRSDSSPARDLIVSRSRAQARRSSGARDNKLTWAHDST